MMATLKGIGARRGASLPTMYPRAKLERLGEQATFDELQHLTPLYSPEQRIGFFDALPEFVQRAMWTNLKITIEEGRRS